MQTTTRNVQSTNLCLGDGCNNLTADNVLCASCDTPPKSYPSDHQRKLVRLAAQHDTVARPVGRGDCVEVQCRYSAYTDVLTGRDVPAGVDLVTVATVPQMLRALGY